MNAKNLANKAAATDQEPLIQISSRQKLRLLLSIFGFILLSSSAFAQWTVDLSRREEQLGLRKAPITEPAPQIDQLSSASATASEEKGLFEKLFEPSLPTQEIVILNTDQGFIPSTVRVREGLQYKVVVVNVNEKSKNISFVLDSFSEHHATFYGKMKSFLISPKKEGVYTFVSPETSAQGRLVVHPAGSKDGFSPTPTNPNMPMLTPEPSLRSPASLLSE